MFCQRQPQNECSSSSGGRLPELDGLRAIAVLLVLVAHHFCFVPVPWVQWVGEKGWVGVDLFFVLSGFLIGGILLDHRPATNYYRTFYLRRFLRIVPIYAVLVLPGLLILTLGLQRHLSGHLIAGQSAIGAWLCVFFVQNLSPLLPWWPPAYLWPTWSVAVEEQFYLLLPPLVRNLSRRRLLLILLPAIAFAPVLRGLLFLFLGPETAGWAAYTLLPCRWDALLLGVACALAFREPAFRSWFARQLPKVRIGWGISALVSLAWLSATAGRQDPSLEILGYTAIDACFALTLLLAVLSPGGSLHRALGWRGFKPVATTSYALYLLHSPMLGVTESVFRRAHITTSDRINWTHFGMAMVALAATIVVSALSWKYFESRMIRLGHRHPYQMPPAGGNAPSNSPPTMGAAEMSPARPQSPG